MIVLSVEHVLFNMHKGCCFVFGYGSVLVVSAETYHATLFRQVLAVSHALKKVAFLINEVYTLTDN